MRPGPFPQRHSELRQHRGDVKTPMEGARVRWVKDSFRFSVTGHPVADGTSGQPNEGT